MAEATSSTNHFTRKETVTTRGCSARRTTRSTLFSIEVNIDENVIQHQVKTHHTGFSDKCNERIRFNVSL